MVSARPQRPSVLAAHWARACTAFLALSVLCACGDQQTSALEDPDPLHADAVHLPAVNLGLPPRALSDSADEGQTFPVPPPPFSPGIFPCSRCHEGGAARPDTAPAMPHLTHLDQGFACADCHSGGDPLADVAIPSADVCGMCHGDYEEDEDVPGVAKYFASIKTGDDTYTFPHRWKTADVNPNHAGHAKAGVECATCHGEPSNGPFVKPRNVTLMQTCVACHAERSVSTDCATCHRETRQPQHSNIVLKHAPVMTTCFTCHDPDNRDVLHLVNDEKVTFEESYKLCGQCHGPKYRDWKEGLHGKRVGMWDGKREYLLCVHCHTNPHQPHFPDMQPLAPPMRPEDIR